MPDHGCFWHLIDTIPGAVLIEWTRNTSGALIGVVFEWILRGKPTTSGSLTAQGYLDGESKPVDKPK